MSHFKVFTSISVLSSITVDLRNRTELMWTERDTNLKLLYSVSGVLCAPRRYTCVHCAANKSHMNLTTSELCTRLSIHTVNDLPPRTEVMDLRNSDNYQKLQKSGTYNMTGLRRAMEINMVPPPLHIKLGLVNKIAQCLNLELCLLDRRTHSKTRSTSA